MSDFAFRCGQIFSRGLFGALSRCHIDGLEHIPRDRSYLMIANHISHADPNFLAMRLPSTMDYLADIELLALPIIGPILKSWNAFSMDRSKNDMGAIRECINRLKAGRPVGVFPERGLRYGERSILHGAELSPGTASLAIMARVPILPVAIIGSDQLYQWRSVYRRPRVYVRYGPCLPAPSKGDDRAELSTRMADAIRTLADSLRIEFDIGEPIWPAREAQQRWADG